MDTVISHIIGPYLISISRMTISIWWMTISIYYSPYRYLMSHINIPIDIPLTSDLPYRSSISDSHIDIGSYLVTLVQVEPMKPMLKAPGIKSSNVK